MIVRTSAMDLTEHIPYYSSLKRVFFFWVIDDRLVHYGLKNLTDETEETDVSVQGGGRSHSHLLETFLPRSTGIGNDFCFKQWLNNLARIGDNSWLMFLKTTTGHLSGSVAFSGSRF